LAKDINKVWFARQHVYWLIRRISGRTSLLVVFSCEEANKTNCNQRVRASQGFCQWEEGGNGRAMVSPYAAW